jgi:hypothetical protein
MAQQILVSSESSGILDGKCLDCGRIIQIGMWPYRCNGERGSRSHLEMTRLAYGPRKYDGETGPPVHFNPIKGPEVTRDFMEVGPDGKATFTPMKASEYDHRNLPDLEHGDRRDL